MSSTPVPEEMSREELEQEVSRLREIEQELRDYIDAVDSDTLNEQKFNVFLRQLTGGDIHPQDDPADHFGVVKEFGETVARIEDTLEQHGERLAQLEDDSRHAGKSKKVRDIVEFATNKADNDQNSVFITPEEITGATGVTRRYAYDLVDDLPGEYSFILNRSDVQQYGSLELDHEKRTKGVVVVVREGVHEELDGVNLFTTRSSAEGGER